MNESANKMLGWAAGRASSNRTVTLRKVSVKRIKKLKKSAVLECRPFTFSKGKDIAFESTKHSVGGEVEFHKRSKVHRRLESSTPGSPGSTTAGPNHTQSGCEGCAVAHPVATGCRGSPCQQ